MRRDYIAANGVHQQNAQSNVWSLQRCSHAMVDLENRDQNCLFF